MTSTQNNNDSVETRVDELSTIMCRKCGVAIAPGHDFCPKCGTPVKRICPKCNTELDDDQEYCPKCGTKYSDGVRAIDIKNSTNSLKANFKDNKKTIVIVCIAIALVIGAFFVYKAISKPNFQKMVEHVVAEHPDEPEYEGFLVGNGYDLIFARVVKIGEDGKWMKVDSNPADTEGGGVLEFQREHLMNVTLDLIEYTNSQLGFSDLVLDNMLETTWAMGEQTAESKKATVKWTYHPDKGFEATYTLK